MDVWIERKRTAVRGQRVIVEGKARTTRLKLSSGSFNILPLVYSVLPKYSSRISGVVCAVIAEPVKLRQKS